MSRELPQIGQPYVVRGGDTITEIAFLAYGDARRYVALVDFNAEVIGANPARLCEGTVLQIPEPNYLPAPTAVGSLRGTVGKTYMATKQTTTTGKRSLPVVK